MKKILLSIYLFFIFFGKANASLLEIEKCFLTKNWWDYTKTGEEAFPPHDKIKWTKENYFRESTRIKISKKIWKKNFKSFVRSFPYGEQYYWNTLNIYPRIDYVLLKTIDYSPKQIDEILSLGGLIIKKYDRVVYSIDPEAGTLNLMRVKSDDYHNHMLSVYSELSLGHRIFSDGEKIEMPKKEKDRYKNKYFKTMDEGPIKTDTYLITFYAGGLLKAKHEMGLLGNQLVVDFNNSSILQKSSFETDFNKYRCPDLLADQNEGEGPSGGSGTAFFINSKGYLLTNNHVIEGCKLSKISYKNKDVNAKLIATDKTLDLALLKVNVRPKSFITFSKDEPKKLNEIFVAGYPLGKGLSDDLKISSGIISSLKGFEDNSNEIQIDAPVNPGNSGGPIINKNGSLVGIAVSGMAKDQTEGINFGIKASAAESFLKSNQINPIKSLNSKRKDNDQLLNILEEGTVYTYCE